MKADEVLSLIKTLPKPGRILIDSIENGVQGISLRPKSIPDKPLHDSMIHSVSLQLIRDGKPFGENDFRLRTSSEEWSQWIKKQTIFLIKNEDTGKEISVLQERLKNFNRNLLHKFLDRFSIHLTMSKESQERVLDEDNYPLYFWDRPATVSGTCRSSNMSSIELTINGLAPHGTIECRETFFFKYWEFLPEDKMPLMKIIIKWHKALVSLYHLMKRDGIDLPINLKDLNEKCWSEIKTQL